ncbi:substrate-binding domain-containing protein [Paenibacillus hexagrammi]|uniref:Substrate-binding domain-containing protein n=1 Tax=Paenibacillus hexagrammi TaxID=2908839 RepID=A0ABY3SFE8_9BACL|nr:substrate-binding domain-containing protein [Paenibacillus sp. YPD9-1]UJF32748.1 substrate-binding domain-containing protein [Paenibacillus sp. YPD9-1]
MKKLLMVYAVLIATFMLFLYVYAFREDTNRTEDAMYGGLHGDIGEKYVMVNFQSGIDYWKSCLKGFEDASASLNVSVEYRGATQYDANEERTVLEQVIAKKPAGIAVSAINPDALVVSINKAVEAGIPVVLFDSGAPKSKAYSFLGTDNYNAGVKAANQMAELMGGSGKAAVITLPGQLNHQERTRGFQDTIRTLYPDIQVIAVEDGKGDQLVSGSVAKRLLGEYPDLTGIFATEANGGVGVGNAVKEAGRLPKVKIIGFDTDKGTLDMVKSGIISATLAQGTWNMGYWSLMQLFHLKHGIVQQVADWQGSGMPLVPTYVDTGITVVTRQNVDSYYAK